MKKVISFVIAFALLIILAKCVSIRIGSPTDIEPGIHVNDTSKI